MSEYLMVRCDSSVIVTLVLSFGTNKHSTILVLEYYSSNSNACGRGNECDSSGGSGSDSSCGKVATVRVMV